VVHSEDSLGELGPVVDCEDVQDMAMSVDHYRSAIWEDRNPICAWMVVQLPASLSCFVILS
jgi:hypothetical protein